ncbi:MAG: glycine--tRNA ligase subunit beta, partial [Casimicrobiaceae bacterium]
MSSVASTAPLLVELFTEELPPKALERLSRAFAEVFEATLAAEGLIAQGSTTDRFATPRRLACRVNRVHAQGPERAIREKLMPVTVARGPDGAPTAALRKKLAASGRAALAEVDFGTSVGHERLVIEADGKADYVWCVGTASGKTIEEVAPRALEAAIAKLPIPKVMTYQLETDCELPGWSSVNFVRPAHGLVALHGSTVVPVKALGLTAGNSTQGHRFEAAVSPVGLANADSYADTLRKDGAVIASFAERKAEIARQLAAAAAKVGNGARPIEDEALLDEVTALVERPNVVTCSFETE